MPRRWRSAVSGWGADVSVQVCRRIVSVLGQSKRVLSYATVSQRLLPSMHNECPRRALSIEFEYNRRRYSLTWLSG